MTRTIRRLEHAGFVRRRRCETDRRVTIVEPTAASFALREKVESLWAELELRTTADLTAAQRDQLQQLLEQVEDSLAASAAPIVDDKQISDEKGDLDVRIHQL